MHVELQAEGEGAPSPLIHFRTSPHFVLEEIIQEKKLTTDEASKSLSTLGKDESAVRYAYLMMNVSEMKLTDISVIVNYNHLMFVDVSGNLLNLEALQVLSQIPFLLYIRAERNRLESAALNVISYLQVLILNKNSISETGDISQPILETLELADNSIFTIQFDPDRLEGVRHLIISGNHLLDTSGTYPRNVERLYLGKNKITRVNTDFSQLPKLQCLHLRDNNIRKLSGFSSALENLNYINLRTNKITKMRQFRRLACIPHLDTVIFLDNPVYAQTIIQKGEGADTERGYTTEETEDEEKTEISGEGGEPRPPVDILRLRLLVLLPNLKRINKDMVTADEREVMEITKQKLLNEIFEEESSEDEMDVPTTTTNYTSDFTTDSEMESGHPVSELTREETDIEDNDE